MVVFSISCDEKDLQYLKEKGIKRSKFFRAAIDAYRDGNFEYDMRYQR